MLPRLLMIGARGFLGSFVVKRASSCYQVIRGDRTRDSGDAGAAPDAVIDITQAASIRSAFAEFRPDAVLLLAAISDIDRCQRDPKAAVAVNLTGAERVAEVCAQSGARLLFTSTGAVFDGRKHGYSEEDEVSPLSVYGETKANAEIAVMALVPNAIVARVSLILGRTGKGTTNSLVDSMIRRWGASEVLSASVLESRNPIDASTLSQWFVELLKDEQCKGIFHTGAIDSMTRFDLARSIADRIGVSPELVKPELHPAPGRAPRGMDQLLLTEKISRVCATQPPSCAEVIERSLHELA